MKFRILPAAAALALASTGALAQNSNQGVSKTEITLGSIQDLSGPIAGFGKQVRLGMMLRVDEINEQGGINGRKIKLIVEDSAYDPKKAVLAAQKLVNQDKIFAMVAHIGTAQNLAAMPVQFEKNVINFFPVTAAREMYDPLHRLKYSFAATYYDQMRTAVPKLAKEKSAKKVCTMYQDDEFGLEVMRGAEDGLKAGGMALAESGFDPLSRSCRFMLTEEAHHLFVGESGIARVLERTCQVMQAHKVSDPAQVRLHGVIDLPTLQRYLNFHFSVTIDLFGADESSNAAIFYNSGLKGRFEETKRDDDHRLQGQTYGVLAVQDGKLVERQVPMLNALNEVLRDDYIKDSIGGVNRWNKVIEKAGIPFRLVTPHKAFNRKIGTLSGVKVSPDGRVVSDAEWAANEKHWLPSAEDRAFVASLMGRVVEPGRFANWIAPPVMGINRQPIDFQYVRFN